MTMLYTFFFAILGVTSIFAFQVELEDQVCFDPNGPQNPFFSSTYSEARRKFLRAASGVCRDALRPLGRRVVRKKRRRCLHTIKIDVETERTIDVDPYIDILYLRGTAESSKLMLVIAGTHGGEGYAGSAIQTAFLNDLTIDRPTGQIMYKGVALDHDILFIHPVNPYGMHLFRRFNEQNIDINRNAIYDDAVWAQITQETYTSNVEFKALLDAGVVYADRPIDVEIDDQNWWPLLFGVVGVLGEAQVNKAVIQGHYFYPETIFYGGQGLSQELQKLDYFFKNELEDYLKMPLDQYEKFTLLDLHTGLGEFAEASYAVPTQESFDALLNILGPEEAAKVFICLDFSNPLCLIYRDQIGALTQTPFSDEYFSSIDDRVIWLTEFGTDPILLEIKDIKNENIAFQNEYCSYNYFKTQQESRERFYPEDSEEWKDRVVTLGLGIIDAIIQDR